jgi:NADPH-dependent ferric siderophore reductase
VGRLLWLPVGRLRRGRYYARPDHESVGYFTVDSYIHGAKGVITTWSGTEASKGNSCVTANKTLHPQVLEILNSEEP